MFSCTFGCEQKKKITYRRSTKKYNKIKKATLKIYLKNEKKHIR